MRSIRSRINALLLVAVLGALAVAELEGRGASVDAEHGTFTIRVTSTTRFERVTFSSLRAGRTVEATIRRVDGTWRATDVEPNAGSHAGDHNGGGGNDDPPGHH